MGIINKIKSKKAQQMVEMAVVLPVIILCIGILITCGQLIFGKMTVQMAAYEGARKAVVISNANTAKNTAINASTQVLKNGIAMQNYNFSFQHGGWSKGNYLTYTVSADVKTLFPVINTSFKANSTTNVKGHIVMMIERN